MAEKLRRWTSLESKKMCDAFWKLEPESQVRTYILALAEKVHSVMQERGSELDLDENEIAGCQQMLVHLKNGEKEQLGSIIESLSNKSELRKYIKGIQRRAANMMETHSAQSDRKNYPWYGLYYHYRYSDIIREKIFPETEENESVFFHRLFPEERK